MLLGHQLTLLRMSRVLARTQRKVTTIPTSKAKVGSFSLWKNVPSQKPYVSAVDVRASGGGVRPDEIHLLAFSRECPSRFHAPLRSKQADFPPDRSDPLL